MSYAAIICRHMSQIIKKISIYWKKLSLLTRSLLILFLVNGVLISILLFLFAGNFKDTTLAYAGRYVLFHVTGFKHASNDSWEPMIVALEHLHKSPEEPVYSKIFFDENIKFQYPPSSLLIIEPITKIHGVSRLNLKNLLNNLSWFCILIIGILTAKLLFNNYRNISRRELFPVSRIDIFAFYSVVLLITITFYPIIRSFVLGQVQTVVTLLGTASLLAWQYERKRTAGLLIGLCCLFKPHWGFLLLWSVLRRQWGMFMVGIITATLCIGISISIYGIHHYVDYISVLSFLSRHGESFFTNQSINGLMNRLLFNGNNLQWVADSFPPFNPVVCWATLISTILIIGVALFWKFRNNNATGTTEFAIIMLSVTIASPIAWEHHYGILLPIFAIVAPISISKHLFGKWTIAYLLLTFFLASQRLDIINRLANTHLNIFQSYLFFAGVITLLSLYRVSVDLNVSK